MIVLCPTRGRSQTKLQEVVDSYIETVYYGGTVFKFIQDVDDDIHMDPLFRDRWVIKLTEPTGNMRAALNDGAKLVLQRYPLAGILGFIGDDHRFRTKDWDVAIYEALDNGGMAYANDGVQGAALPTQWFVTADIVRKLGWLALPACNHFYLDNAWLDLANAAKCRYYLPDVMIEHMHFSYGKSAMDATYEHTMRVGGGDQLRYNNWRWSKEFLRDVYAIQQALEERK